MPSPTRHPPTRHVAGSNVAGSQTAAQSQIQPATRHATRQVAGRPQTTAQSQKRLPATRHPLRGQATMWRVACPGPTKDGRR